MSARKNASSLGRGIRGRLSGQAERQPRRQRVSMLRRALGATAELRHRVASEDLVCARVPGMPPTVSSPALLYLMEIAAYEAIAGYLDAGQVSVGVQFEFDHLAPSPRDALLVARAEVSEVHGRKITFSICVSDGDEVLARGVHTRVIVGVDRFNATLAEKRRRCDVGEKGRLAATVSSTHGSKPRRR